MKKLIQTFAVLAIALSGTASASLTTFDFSYNFNDGVSLITGSLEGSLDASGIYIDNISDIQMTLDGVQFNGPLVATAWNTATTSWDDKIPAIVSTHAALNNFMIADTDVALNSNPTNFFMFINDPNIGTTIFAVNNNITDAYGNPLYQADDLLGLGTWTVTAIAAVAMAEPDSLPLLMMGLGLLANSARRIRCP